MSPQILTKTENIITENWPSFITVWDRFHHSFRKSKQWQNVELNFRKDFQSIFNLPDLKYKIKVIHSYSILSKLNLLS